MAPTRLFRSLLVACLLAGVAAAQGPILTPGYESTLFFTEPLSNLTGLALDAKGRVYTCCEAGIIRRLTDADRDGIAESDEVVWPGTGLVFPTTGILWLKKKLYVSHMGVISRLDDTDGDGLFDTRVDLVSGLPVGWHQNNGLFTDGKFIYFGLGTEIDHDPDDDPRQATLMRLDPADGATAIVATGLRNVFDGVVHPAHGHIYVGDNGPNLVPGNPDPPDELNRIVPGLNYGHPNYWGDPPPGSGTQAPALLLPPHSAPCGMALNRNEGLSGFRDELALVSFDGTLNKLPVVYRGTGAALVWSQPFASGFDTPIDLVFNGRGAIYVAEYASRKVYRIKQKTSSQIVIEGHPSIGNTFEILVQDPRWPGSLFFPAASDALAAVPTPIGSKGFEIYLDTTSPIYELSTDPTLGVFNFPWPGVLDADGRAVISITLPNDANLVGLVYYLQYTLWDPVGLRLRSASPVQEFRILPELQ